MYNGIIIPSSSQSVQGTASRKRAHFGCHTTKTSRGTKPRNFTVPLIFIPFKTQRLALHNYKVGVLRMAFFTSARKGAPAS